jgi:hypothetical protein
MDRKTIAKSWFLVIALLTMAATDMKPQDALAISLKEAVVKDIMPKPSAKGDAMLTIVNGENKEVIVFGFYTHSYVIQLQVWGMYFKIQPSATQITARLSTVSQIK